MVERARAAGVGRLVTVATRRVEWDEVRRLTALFPEVYAAVGVHPHHAADAGEAVTVEDLEAAVRDNPKVVGIGESGLDYFYDFTPRAVQESVFRVQAIAARRAGVPLIIHSREAESDTVRVVREVAEAPGFDRPLTGVLHCFSAGPALAKAGLDLGFFLSFAGIVTFKKADALRTVAATVPLDRLLVETDSPYLAPVPYRGKTCEPAYVARTAEVLAGIKGVSPAELAARTTNNFFRLFTKVPPP